MEKSKPSRSEFATVRGMRYHLRRWGNPDAPLLFMLHGWMDVSATFQFLVDQLQREWNIIAPDWRGCGKSEWSHQSYAFSDLIADLDEILEQFSGGKAATIIGHSMGANIAGLYAGIRPERVAHLVTLEGIGHWSRTAGEIVAGYAEWLESARQPIKNPAFASRLDLSRRLMRSNPRLTEERANFLAEHIGDETCEGKITLAVDPYHRITFSHLLHSNSDYRACWGKITAAVLWIVARQSAVMELLVQNDPPGSAFDYASRLASFQDVEEATLDDAGHNMHHDQPVVLAGIIEDFLARKQ